MDPATMAMIAKFLPSILGGKQIGPAAPAPNLGGLLGPGGIDPTIRKIGELSAQNNFGQTVQKSAAETTAPTPPQEPKGLFGSVFGNLDANLASPSKQLGLGLLGEIDPRLAMAGLAAAGLLGPNSVFGR